jgi:hypothetical protein
MGSAPAACAGRDLRYGPEAAVILPLGEQGPMVRIDRFRTPAPAPARRVQLRPVAFALVFAFAFVAASPAGAQDAGAGAPAAEAPPARVEPPLAGLFTFAGGEAERRGVAQAIDRSVHPLFFAIRGIARGKLEDRTAIARTIAFRFEPPQVRCSIPGAPDAVSPESGAAVDYKVMGDTVKLSHRKEGDRLVQTFTSGDGTRTNVFVPSADGKSFTMQVTITSPRLSVPVRYALTYARR